LKGQNTYDEIFVFEKNEKKRKFFIESSQIVCVSGYGAIVAWMRLTGVAQYVEK
jgi:hypothetical protein